MTELVTSLRLSPIPGNMHGGILRWVENGIPPGHFLTAVLCNDLREACTRADDQNIHLIPEYVSWLYNHAPGQCWGSPERFDAWQKLKAAQRAYAEPEEGQ